MILYDKRDNEYIDVYSMESRLKDLKEYKERLLSNPKFYEFSTDDGPVFYDYFYPSADIDMDYLEDYFYGIQSFSAPVDFSEQDKADTYLDKVDSIMEKYFSGKYDSIIPKKISSSSDEEKYILVPNNPIPTNKLVNYFNANYLLGLPKELFLLQSILTNRFSNLRNENINDQLDLFDIEYLKSFSIDELRSMIEYGLYKEPYLTEIIKKANSDSMILKKANHIL